MSEQNATDEIIDENSDGGTPEVITQEIATKYGLSKNMIGKPKDEIFEAYQNLNKLDTKLSQNVKTLQTEIEAMKDKLTAKEAATATRQAEKEVTEELGDPPEQYEYDSVEKYKAALKSWTNKALDIRATALEKALEEKFDKKYGARITESEQAQIRAQVERDTNLLNETLDDSLNDLYDGELPEGVSVDTLIDEWEHSLTDDESKLLSERNIYANNPKKMAKDILAFYKASLYDKDKDSNKNKNAAEKATINIKDKLKAQATKVGTSSRQKAQVEKSAMGRLADSLEAEAEWAKAKD